MRRFVNLSSLGTRQNSQAPTTAAASNGSKSLSAPSNRLLRSSTSSLSTLQAEQSLQAPIIGFRKLSSWVGGSGSSLSSGSSSNKSGSGESGSSTKKRRSPISSSGNVSKSSSSSNRDSNSIPKDRSRSKSNSRINQNQKGNKTGGNARMTTNNRQQEQGGSGSDNCSSSSVKHDKDGRRFTLDLGNNQVAHIAYKPVGKNKLEFYHTEVPSELRGKGIGKALARGAFDCVSASNMKLKLTCSYLVNYLEKFADPKHKKLVEH